MVPRQLTPRQAQWMEVMSGFRFKIVYRPGECAVMPDALSRRADYHPEKGKTNEAEQNIAQALPSYGDLTEGSPTEVLRALQSATTELSPISTSDISEGLIQDEIISPLRSELLALTCRRCNHSTCRVSTTPPLPLSLVDVRRRLHLPAPATARWDHRGLLLLDDRVYLPDVHQARLHVLQSRHDSALAGHPGVTKILDLIARDYIWPRLRRDVEVYIEGYAVCQRIKSIKQPEHGHLKSLELSARPWQHITMDFIEKLPQSRGCDSILVVVDRATKWAIFISTTTTMTSAQLADVLIDQVFSQHDLPDSIVSDRGSKFIA